MNAFLWYLAGVATLPLLFLLWLGLGLLFGRGYVAIRTTVNGHTTAQRIWGSTATSGTTTIAANQSAVFDKVVVDKRRLPKALD